MARRRKLSFSDKAKAMGCLVVLVIVAGIVVVQFTRENPEIVFGSLAVIAVGFVLVQEIRRRTELAEVARRDAALAAAAEERRARLLGYDLEDLDQLSGAEFEAWIAAVLEAAGFETRDIQTSGDFGVDVIAEYAGTRFGIQAKRYSSNVGNSAVQEANAGSDFHDCHIAAVVTQAGFTRAARAQAERLSRPCLLIGREELPEMVQQLQAAARRGQG